MKENVPYIQIDQLYQTVISEGLKFNQYNEWIEKYVRNTVY